MFPERFSLIDELTRSDHFYLDDSDDCYYLGEYTARAGYAFSDTNQLIFNLKKSVTKKGRSEYRYKIRDIIIAGRAIRKAFGNDEWLENSPTFVPIPPSKAKNDPEYDDRMTQVLAAMSSGLKVDVREIVLQNDSSVASHESDDRSSPDELVENYRVDENLIVPTPELIIVVDDVLTTGSHFKAVKNVLQAKYPDTKIIGVFVARRALKTVDVSDFF